MSIYRGLKVLLYKMVRSERGQLPLPSFFIIRVERATG